LESQVGSQARLDFHQPMSSGQQADQGIIELLGWRMLHRLLLDLHLSADRAKQVELLHFHADGYQRRYRAKMARRHCDRLVHGDAPSSDESFFSSSVAMEHSPCFSQALQRLASLSLVWAKLRNLKHI
jgi:hypothetical protein